MKLILKYIKPYILPVILSLLFLFTQAITDLSLPNIMSEIVDTGIQNSGISGGAPEVISDSHMELIKSFMTNQNAEKFESAYTLIPAGKSGTLSQTYPKASETDVFSLNKSDEQTDKYYSDAAYALTLLLKDTAESSGAYLSTDDEETTAVTDKQLSALTDVISALPQKTKNTYIRQAAEDNSMLNEQISAVLNKAFYSSLGADIASIQQSYILFKGLEMLLTALLGVAAGVFVGFISAKVSSAVARNLRHDVFKKVTYFSNSEMDRFSTSSLITRTTNDITQIQNLIVMGLRMMCFAPVMGIGGLIMALNKSVSLSWILLLAVILLFGIIFLLLKIAMPKFKILQKLIDRLNLVSRENLSGIMVIRAFRNEKYEQERFEKANRDFAFTNRFTQRAMSFMMPAMTFLINIITVMIVWFGAEAIAGSSLQVGDLMAYIQYAMHVIMSFSIIAMIFVMIPRALVSAVRVQEVLDCEYSISDPENPETLKQVKGDIVFKNVSFKYGDAEQNVIENISFEAKAGETTAFIGSTGSGKSTLINLIPRFYDVTDGQILLDGIDIRSITQKELRKNIGYIPQKGVLFSGSIKSNVSYGNGDISDEDILKAIETAQASDFVMSKDEGVMAPISQGGTNVSGGQKQRLSIARALSRKPAIYIFDDSFSALDFKTDAALRKALKSYTGDSTVLIVAQRVSTIMDADKIIVLDSGKMVGCGTHKQLLQNCREYREIAESQLSKEEL